MEPKITKLMIIDVSVKNNNAKKTPTNEPQTTKKNFFNISLNRFIFNNIKPLRGGVYNYISISFFQSTGRNPPYAIYKDSNKFFNNSDKNQFFLIFSNKIQVFKVAAQLYSYG